LTPPHLERAFGRFLAPELSRLGFRSVTPPKGWHAPSKLYERNNCWFALEWDWQDNYIRAALGRLYRFQDVMPSVIVRGPYVYEAMANREDPEAFLAAHLPQVAQDLPDAVEHFDERLPTTSATERERWERSEGGEAAYQQYLAGLGGELTLLEWPGSSRGAA
jgi:hypothetical protein